MRSELKRALVLSGGGARGAYEAGVLAYIYRDLPQARLAAAPLSLLCGTSVGALHACFLASAAHLPHNDVDTIVGAWRSLKMSEVLRVGPKNIWHVPKELRAMWRNDRESEGLLIDVPRLQNKVTRHIAWPHIHNNVRNGLVDGLTVSTTHISSGRTVVFVERPDGTLPHWGRDERRAGRASRIGPLHALASAAIPLMFPPIYIDGAYYCDGGLRQNTPLSPALRLGADKVLVIAVGHGQQGGAEPKAPDAPAAAEPEPYPGAATVLGKVFNALLLDHLDYDLAQLQGFNRLLEDGKTAFGPDFVTKLGQSTERFRGARYRKVDPLVIRPSRDLSVLAAQWLTQNPIELGPVIKWLLRQLGEEGHDDRADLLSYVGFDASFAELLISLGMHDAHAARDKLLDFFAD